MDVTVNIHGNAQPLRDELDNVADETQNQPSPTPGRQPDDSRQPNLPPSDRLVEDLRRIIIEQGNNNYRERLNQVGAQQRTALEDEISQRYGQRRDETGARMQAEYERIDRELEERRKEGLNNLGNRANDPFYQSILDSQIESERERQYKKVGSMFDAEFDEIDKQEAQERTDVEKALTDAIKRLTGEMEKRDKEEGDAGKGSDPNSYINQLREQRRQLLLDRDNAADEEGALAAQGRINAVDEQLRRVMEGGRQQQGSRMALGLTSAMGIGSSISSGDVSGALISGGSLAAVMGANPYVAAALIASGAIGKASTFVSSGYDDLAGLAAFRSTAGGQGGKQGMGFLAQNLDGATAYGLDPASLGLDQDEFYKQAVQRTRARGSGDDWYREVMSQIALERNLGLEENSLTKAGQYDRYGQNVTDAISRLTTVLMGIEGSGVSSGDFTRVQEKFDIQQQLMGSYMSRTDRPNYDVANNTLAAFSATGVTQDARMGGDIASFQNMIQNPMNERMKALIYGTVADIMPETGGRMDLIDRAIRDPENEGRIMQAVVQRIQQQFGGTDTTMGYFAFKALLPDIAPDRLDEYISQITSGDAGSLLARGGARNQNQLDAAGEANKVAWTQQSQELVSGMTQGIESLKNFFTTKGVKVFFGDPGATPNSTKQGN